MDSWFKGGGKSQEDDEHSEQLRPESFSAIKGEHCHRQLEPGQLKLSYLPHADEQDWDEVPCQEPAQQVHQNQVAAEILHASSRPSLKVARINQHRFLCDSKWVDHQRVSSAWAQEWKEALQSEYKAILQSEEQDSSDSESVCQQLYWKFECKEPNLNFKFRNQVKWVADLVNGIKPAEAKEDQESDDCRRVDCQAREHQESRQIVTKDLDCASEPNYVVARIAVVQIQPALVLRKYWRSAYSNASVVQLSAVPYRCSRELCSCGNSISKELRSSAAAIQLSSLKQQDLTSDDWSAKDNQPSEQQQNSVYWTGPRQ